MAISPVRLNHAVLSVAELDRAERSRQQLIDAGAHTGESSHGATRSVYGADPDGNEFELVWMLPRPRWGPYENGAPIAHLALNGEVQRWTGVRTAGHLAPDTQETQP